MKEQQPSFHASEVLHALEKTWRRIQEHHSSLPFAVITLGQGSTRAQPHGLTRGHWAESRWAEATDGLGKRDLFHECMLAGERLIDGEEGVLSTLLHEAAHALATARGIKETSRRGQYHNGKFKALAEEMMLEVAGRDKTRGFTSTALTDDARQRYKKELSKLAKVIQLYRRHEASPMPAGGEGTENQGEDEGEEPTKPKATRVCLTCQCDAPRKIYVAPGIADLGEITCQICEMGFDI